MSDFRAVVRERYKHRICGTCAEPFQLMGPEVSSQELVQIFDKLAAELGRSRDYVATMVVALGIEALLDSRPGDRGGTPHVSEATV
jgi:hypothetical protein